ncbi:hypothetical protein [Dyadobacter luteus]|uniref:hypothetical protein n=1 Tax=Dyadobacter luteus TaxID=2259619 RepID=UPI001E465F0E|nr:hypothetical protein [Dyadobacter luteus]
MKSQYSIYAGALLALLLNSCIKDHPPQVPLENASAFTEIASIDLGGAAASEISAYDPAKDCLQLIMKKVRWLKFWIFQDYQS